MRVQFQSMCWIYSIAVLKHYPPEYTTALGALLFRGMFSESFIAVRRDAEAAGSRSALK